MAVTVGSQVSNGNRKRNTSNNGMSKQDMYATDLSGLNAGGLPALDPAMVANYYGQIQTFQSQLSNTLAELKAQRVGYKGEAKVSRADARQEGQAALSEGINASLERGMLGGSADVEGRIGTRANTKSGIADINRQLWDALAQNRMQGTDAALQYQQGVQGVTNQALAARMQLQAEEKQNALQIQIAQMNAHAADIQNAASLRMAGAQLSSSEDIAKALHALANNPQTFKDLLSQYPQLAALFGGGTGSSAPTYAPHRTKYGNG